MPSNLTDLMERATSFAPPEPHDAADITRVAARAYRRRTTGIVAGVAAAVVVAGVAGYGITRGHDNTPEPAGPYQYGQQLKLSDAVPVKSIAGYRELHYGVKPVDQSSGSGGAFSEYTDIDANGRLTVLRRTSGSPTAPIEGLVLSGTDSSSSSAAAPPSPGKNGSYPVTWYPQFTGDGRLLWRASLPVVGPSGPDLHVTDLSGGDDEPLSLDTSKIAVPTGDGRAVWVAGDRLWFTDIQPAKNLKAAPTYDLYSYPLHDAGAYRLVANQIVGAAGAGGFVGWVTRSGRAFLGPAEGPIESFDLPLDKGCRVHPFAGQFGQIAVTDGLLAFAERCGTGEAERQEAVVVDARGRMVSHVDAAATFDYSLSGGTFAFAGIAGPASSGTGLYHVDLRTGILAQLGRTTDSVQWPPVVAGRYVLWHDANTFHVAQFAD